jgi:hypothetical protein
MSPGQEMVGAGELTTLTVNVQLAPVALEVIVLIPAGRNEPDAGELVTAPQSPVTDAPEKFTNAPG